MSSRIRVAVAGNPNAGKTSLFNRLTGARQHVGNYPGVTVERVEGFRRVGDAELVFVDLPGTYSLAAYSEEERVARRYLLDQRPDVVIDVVDASNIERNLYLTVQLIELGVPLVVAFNMSDVARARGVEFDLEQLGRFLGAPIVCTVGNKGEGVDRLVEAVLSVARGEWVGDRPQVRYGRELEAEIGKIVDLLGEHGQGGAEARWTAVKLLENDLEVREGIGSSAVLDAVGRSVDHIRSVVGDPPEIVIADRRYGFISGACQETVRMTVESRHRRSDRIDAVLIHPLLALPIFLGLMYLTFLVTFRVAEPLMHGIEWIFGHLGDVVSGFWAVGSESVLRSLLVDGVIAGVGGVLVFLPNIALLFAAIAILEDSGYMARAAFIMDRLMHRIGLHGKSFIPMVIGFGCSVPAILATRMLSSRRDRLTTMFVVPLMSCGGRLPIYALLIPAFFPERWRAPVLWLIYLLGIVLAVLTAKLLRHTVLRGETEPFVMELPPYRLPTLRGVLIHTWYRSWQYVKKAGTVILVFSILMWVLTSYPKAGTYSMDYAEAVASAVASGEDSRVEGLRSAQRAEDLRASVAGRIGRGLGPVLSPMGFDWRIGTALIGAFAAKEIFVAQLGIVFAVGDTSEGEESLRRHIREAYSPLTGFCVLLFCLVAMPCLATVVATRRESGSWGWAAAQMFGLTGLAWVLVTAVYQIGRGLGIGV